MTARADIPTAEAALAFAAYMGRFPDPEILFQRVEAAGFPLGVEGRLRVMVVLSRLSSLGATRDAGALAEYLVPVLAASAHEQKSIRRVIEEWANPSGASSADILRAQAARDAAVPPEVRRLEQADRSGAVLAAGLFGLGVIAVVALIIFAAISGRSANPATTVVTYSQPVVSLDFGLDPFWRHVFEDTLSRLGFAAVVLIAGLSFVAWRGELKGRLIRQTEETDFIEPFRFSTEIPKWFRTAAVRAAFDRLKRVRLFDTNIIDVQRTIARTTRSGGLPLVVNKRWRELPNYVLLVDRAARHDLAGIFARTVEAALTEARIVYSRYDFSGGLDRLNPVRGGAQADIVDTEYLPFSVVASRHAGERLILIGTGRGFFEVPGFRYNSEGHGTLVRPGRPLADTIHVREFGAAALITPAPVSAWGENEQRLHELGFAIFSADVDGVQNLAAQLMAELSADSTPPPRSPTDEDRFLARLDRDATRLSAAVPPSTAEIERLTRNLRIWAGSSEFYILLAAIAAFPKIDSAFTFVLARIVLGKEMDRDSALFARLIRLPWIRNGYMPDWLRIALVNGLNSEQRRSVQAIQMTMLKETVQAKHESLAPLIDRLIADFQVARELPRGRLDALISRIQPRSMLSADERIFFSVLRDYKLDPELDVIRPEAPEIIAEMIDAPERARRAQIRLAVIALAAIAALLQPWILAAGHGAIAILQRLGTIFSPPPAFSNVAMVFGGVGAVCVALAAMQWLVNMNRDVPIVFRHHFSQWIRQPARTIISDPRITASSAAISTFAAFLFNGNRPGADLVFDVTLLTAGCVIFAWVSVVVPERWWNVRSADEREMLELQVRRDPLTGTIGCLLVVAIWAVPWFLLMLPALADPAGGRLFFAACLGTASWVASSALARRWLLGVSATGEVHRFWIDAGFALVVFLLFATVAQLLTPLYSTLYFSDVSAYQVAMLASPVIYAVHLKATLGLRRPPRPVWGPLINGAIIGYSVVSTAIGARALFVFLVDQYFYFFAVIQVLIVLVGMVADGAVVVFQFRRSGYPGSTSNRLRIKCALLGGVLFLFASLAGFALAVWMQDSPEKRVGLPDIEVFWLFGFLLPAALVVWPMFSLLKKTFGIIEPIPFWRAIVKSPWWATLAMWLTGMVWNISASTGGLFPFTSSLSLPAFSFSIWPLALPIALFFGWRHGERAFAPVLVGTLPLIVNVDETVTTPALHTPGGVWPALAILFLARFAADQTFRQRLLRREHLSWREAFLIVGLLSAWLRIPLGSPVGAITPNLHAVLHINSSFMLAAVAVVIGSSRMPAAPFVVAVIATWLLPELVGINRPGPRPVIFGLTPGDVATVLLVLYGARAWRGYAAPGIGAAISSFTGKMRTKMQGLYLSYGAALVLAILVSSLVPALNVAGINLTFIPNIAAALALMMLTGLIAGNLWAERFPLYPVKIGVAKILRPWLRVAYSTIAVFFLYIMLALAFGARALAQLGVGTRHVDVLPSDLGAVGSAACIIGYLTLGAALRVIAERDGHDWIITAARLWGHLRVPDYRLPRRQGPVAQALTELIKEAEATQRQVFSQMDDNTLLLNGQFMEELLRIMVQFYPSERDIVRFAVRFGIDSRVIPSGLRPRAQWTELIQSLAKTGKLRAAVLAVREDFPNDVEVIDDLLTTATRASS
jgi:hypothetical protein